MWKRTHGKRGKRAILESVDLKKAILVNANFRGANLKNANLKLAKLGRTVQGKYKLAYLEGAYRSEGLRNYEIDKEGYII